MSDKDVTKAEGLLPKPDPDVRWQVEFYGEAVKHIASALREARAEENEACAKVAEEFADAASAFGDGAVLVRYERIAEAIRQRQSGGETR